MRIINATTMQGLLDRLKGLEGSGKALRLRRPLPWSGSHIHAGAWALQPLLLRLLGRLAVLPACSAIASRCTPPTVLPSATLPVSYGRALSLSLAPFAAVCAA